MRTNIFIITVSILLSIVLWISISLSYEYYSEIEVPIKLTSYAKGYSISGEIPETITLKVKAAGWKLLFLDISHSAEYTASVGREIGLRKVLLKDKISENHWIDENLKVLEIYPDTISVNVTKQVEKKVKIRPNLNLTFKTGYGLASEVKVIPDSVIISGSANVISRINEVSTNYLSIENLNEGTGRTISLQPIKNVNFNLSTVQVQLDIQQIVDKEISELEVFTEGVPQDEELILLPNKITIGLRGGINILGKLDSSEIKAKIHYKKVIADTLGSIVPEIVTKKNLNVFFIKPERIKYIIKKLK